MKIKLIIFFLFVILTFPFYKNLLKEQLFTNDDLDAHIMRLMEFDQALKDGHFPVRWSKRVNYGLGYPFLNFNYPLVYYIGEIVYKLGFDFPTTMKLMLALSFPLGGFFSFLWLKERFSLLPSILGGIAYTLIPYHFVNVYIRGAVGEVLALVVVPLGFYCLEKLMKNPYRLNIIFTSLSFAAIMMLHNVIALYFLPIFCVYFLILFLEKNSKKLFVAFTSSILWSFAISAFYLIPLYLYRPLVALDGLKTDFLVGARFASLKDLIYMQWGFGAPKQNFGQGEMSLQLGILHQIFFAASLFLLITHLKKTKNITYYLSLFWVLLFIITAFMMLEISFPVWKIVSILQYQEYPSRLLAIITAASAFLAAFSFSSVRAKMRRSTAILFVILIILGLFYTHRNYARPEQYIPWKHPFKKDGVIIGTMTFKNEHLPVWHSKDEEIIPYIQSKVVSGDAEVRALGWKTNLHVFDVTAKSESIIADRTDYFPGWEVYAKGVRLKLFDPKSEVAKGLITFPLTPGYYRIEVRLKETFEEKIADTISFIGLLAIPMVILIDKRFLRKNRGL